MKLFYICLIPLFMAKCPDPAIPVPGPFTASDHTTLEFKQAMFDGYEKYKNLPSYLPSSAGVNKDVSMFGSKGATYRLCGEEISNIEDVVTNEELVFLYRKNNPNLNISLKDFIGNNPPGLRNENNNEGGGSGRVGC